jgi:hypothetical protein
MCESVPRGQHNANPTLGLCLTGRVLLLLALAVSSLRGRHIRALLAFLLAYLLPHPPLVVILPPATSPPKR